MRSKVKTRIKKKVDAGYELSTFALNVGMGMAALIGVWGLACLIEGFVTNGAGGLLRGFWIALTGHY
jgi:hypothetical protein